MRVYISADYSENSGDRDVVEQLNTWALDSLHKIEFVDTAKVNSGSVSQNPNCRICELKLEFNRQINISSYVIFVVGDKTALRTAGSSCERNKKAWYECFCTPYKQNTNGQKQCTVYETTSASIDVGNINSYSYLQHEFEQAKKREKKIIILYNSFYKQPGWLPTYMNGYGAIAEPFWVRDARGRKAGNYALIKEALGYE